MIAILLIALAAGCASALMFASIISGALISLLLFYLAPLPLMVAATRLGTAQRHHRRHRRRLRPRRDLRPSLWHRLRPHDCAARLVARTSRAAGAARRQRRRVRQRRRAGRADTGMVSGRPHPALDRRFCRADHDGDRCSRLAPTPLRSPSVMRKGLLMVSRIARRGLDRRDRAGDRCAGDRRARSRRHRRHDDADAQPLAGRENRRDVGTIAPSLARPEKR